MKEFMLLIKPAGPDCNLRCSYCFYADKAARFAAGPHRMNDETLERLVQSYLQADQQHYLFSWQGGEPTLMGLDFYRKVVELQQEYCRDGRPVGNALQTNGCLLDEAWCSFLSENQWLVGISLDGPKHLHDHYRKDAAGQGTFDRIMAGIDACRQQDVQFNLLTLLNDKNVTEPDLIFDFVLEHGFRYLQFIPCVEPGPQTHQVADYSITAQQYGDFLCHFFDRWLAHGPEKISVRMFDSVVSYCLTGRPTMCTFARSCDDYVVVEHNGDVFCCDFFVDDPYRLGSILEEPLPNLANNQVKQEFARDKRLLATRCVVCRYKELCWGGCIKHRGVAGGCSDQPSYFCQAYKQFYDHALGIF